MAERDGVGRGKPLYEEKVPRSMRPRRRFSGRRWKFFESLARVFGLTFVFYGAYMATSDLGDLDNLVSLAVSIVGAVVIIYAVEVMTPQYIRNIMPMKVYRDGVEVYSSRLEKLFGRPSFMPRDQIAGIKVSRMKVLVEGEVRDLPVELTFVLTSGAHVRMGRRNSRELAKAIDVLGGLGVREV